MCCRSVQKGQGCQPELCNVAWELQKCMVALISLSRDDIVEASLLGIHRWGTWNLLYDGGGSHPSGQGTWAPRGCCIPPRMIPRPTEPTEQMYTPNTCAPLFPTSKPSCHSSWETKKSLWGTEADPCLTTEWIQSYVEKNKRVPDW